MEIKTLLAYDRPEEIKALFTEYTNMLIEGDGTFKQYLEIQNYDNEILHLTEKYGLPQGRLYLVYCDGEPAGCVALRKIDDENCELKRLYVKPQFRGTGIGGMLAKRIIAEAKEIGYSHILLDTLPFLTAAIEMYKKLGFYNIPKYNNSPMENCVYMKLDL